MVVKNAVVLVFGILVVVALVVVVMDGGRVVGDDGDSVEDDNTVKEVLHISSYCKQTCCVGWYQSR